jgi:hypothetical protein
MYNTQFKVKYYDIKQELLAKIVSIETESGAEHDLGDAYSVDDVNTVCDKLYKDEITSVFNAENIYDDKIDIGMKTIMSKMIVENEDFNHCIQVIKDNLQKYYDGNFSSEEFDDDSFNCIVRLTLFSEPVFHLAHKCICQHLLEGRIDEYLVNELKETIASTINK